MSDVHVEPILGYRAWGIGGGRGDGGHWLSSAADQYRFWAPQQIVPASCWHPHRAPAEVCVPDGTPGCGYYAMKEPPRGLISSGVIQGEVYLWGKVIEHEDGYRAEFAYPAAIYSDSPYATELAALYGVPVKEPPYEPDRKALEDNPGGANYSARATTANTSTFNAIMAQHLSSALNAYATTLGTGTPPAVAPRARKGARLNLWWGLFWTLMFLGGAAFFGVLAWDADGEINRWGNAAFSGAYSILACLSLRSALKPLRAPDGKP